MKRVFINAGFVLVSAVLIFSAIRLSTTGYAEAAPAKSSPTITWLHQFGTDGTDVAYNVDVDGAGNTYVVGYTDNTLPGQASSGETDAFIRKYDRKGNELWTHQFGTIASDYASGVAIDEPGNAYVVGSTGGTLPGQTSSGETDAFVRKYDRWGNELWTHQFGTAGIDIAYSVAVDSPGNAYVLGYTNDTLPGQTSSGDFDIFVRKYDRAGNELWTQQFGTTTPDYARDIAVDRAGNACIVGSTGDTLPGQTSSGTQDAFVRMYDKSGSELWTHQFGTDVLDYAYGVAVDSPGNAYVVGHTNGTLPGQISSGNKDAFIRKYDRTGNELWTRQFGTDSLDFVYSVAVDGPGNAFVLGHTDGILPGQTPSGGQDAFVRQYDRAGNELWTYQFGTAGLDIAYRIAVNSSGNAGVVGFTNGTFPGQTSSGGLDAFVVMFSR